MVSFCPQFLGFIPLPNGRTLWLLSGGGILTTYDTWDDHPPSVPPKIRPDSPNMIIKVHWSWRAPQKKLGIFGGWMVQGGTVSHREYMESWDPYINSLKNGQLGFFHPYYPAYNLVILGPFCGDVFGLDCCRKTGSWNIPKGSSSYFIWVIFFPHPQLSPNSQFDTNVFIIFFLKHWTPLMWKKTRWLCC